MSVLTLSALCRRVLRVTTVTAVLLLPASYGGADEPGGAVTRIEEDWVVTLREPDGTAGTPQMAAVISPLPHLDAEYAVFEINHSSLPTFFAGGLQLQSWRGEQPLHTPVSSNAALLATSGETVTWTVCMSLEDEQLVVEIRDGRSSTWGNFGGIGRLKVTLSTDIPDLSGYSPETSVEMSGIVRAAHQVTGMGITQVRYYSGGDEVRRDETARFAHEYQQRITE